MYEFSKRCPESLMVCEIPFADEQVLVEALAVLPRVHLLRNNVGLLAHAPRKEPSVFEDGGANLAEVVAGKDLACGCFDAVPQLRLRRQQIARPAHSFQGLAHNANQWNNFLGYKVER